MGFSSPGGDGAGADAGASPKGMFDFSSLNTDAPKPTFMDHLGDYMKQRFPVATGLAGAAGVNIPGTPANPAPDITLPEGQTPDFSLVNQNAQPKSSGALKAILSLLG